MHPQWAAWVQRTIADLQRELHAVQIEVATLRELNRRAYVRRVANARADRTGD